jgi:hypothetical protein
VVINFAVIFYPLCIAAVFMNVFGTAYARNKWSFETYGLVVGFAEGLTAAVVFIFLVGILSGFTNNGLYIP